MTLVASVTSGTLVTLVRLLLVNANGSLCSNVIFALVSLVMLNVTFALVSLVMLTVVSVVTSVTIFIS